MSKKRGADDRNEEATPLYLLLHAVDGVVPFLTPALMKECFPASSFGSQLWIGMAVKDTCLQPVYKDGDDPRTSKTRGYTFSGSNVVAVEPWIEPFTRLTVPAFDLFQPNDPTSNPSNHATDKHVMLWTTNGRQPITPAMYFDACSRLKSQHAVTLFDLVPPSGNSSSLRREKNQKKRQLAASQRTKEWWTHFRDALKAVDSEKTQSWMPICVHDNMSTRELEEEIKNMATHSDKDKGDNNVQQRKSQFSIDVLGRVLIGWNHLQLAEKRHSLLAAIDGPVAILSTKSLRQVLEAASHSNTSVVGSNLAQIWAQKKQAFLLALPKHISGKRPQTVPEELPDAHETDSQSIASTLPLNADGCVPLDDKTSVKEHAWYRDKGPLLPGCLCHTCVTHSRSYVYHLVCANELLAEMLLFIHNLHHLLQIVNLFRNVREQHSSPSRQQESEELMKVLLSQLPAAASSNGGNGDN